MPCDMMNGWIPSVPEDRNFKTVAQKVAELEEALCGLCQMFDGNLEMHPQLQDWFDNHKKQPGCKVDK